MGERAASGKHVWARFCSRYRELCAGVAGSLVVSRRHAIVALACVMANIHEKSWEVSHSRARGRIDGLPICIRARRLPPQPTGYPFPSAGRAVRGNDVGGRALHGRDGGCNHTTLSSSTLTRRVPTGGCRGSRLGGSCSARGGLCHVWCGSRRCDDEAAGESYS